MDAPSRQRIVLRTEHRRGVVLSAVDRAGHSLPLDIGSLPTSDAQRAMAS